MIFTIYKGGPPFFFGMNRDSTAEKTHLPATTDQQTWKWEMWKNVLYIITKTVQFYNYVQLSQASITRNTTLDE